MVRRRVRGTASADVDDDRRRRRPCNAIHTTMLHVNQPDFCFAIKLLSLTGGCCCWFNNNYDACCIVRKQHISLNKTVSFQGVKQYDIIVAKSSNWAIRPK